MYHCYIYITHISYYLLANHIIFDYFTFLIHSHKIYLITVIRLPPDFLTLSMTCSYSYCIPFHLLIYHINSHFLLGLSQCFLLYFLVYCITCHFMLHILLLHILPAGVHHISALSLVKHFICWHMRYLSVGFWNILADGWWDICLLAYATF